MLRRLEARHIQEHPFGFPAPDKNRHKRMSGIKDPRGRVGIFARGKVVYGGGSTAAHHKTGYGMGRPPNGALSRRMANLGEE